MIVGQIFESFGSIYFFFSMKKTRCTAMIRTTSLQRRDTSFLLIRSICALSHQPENECEPLRSTSVLLFTIHTSTRSPENSGLTVGVRSRPDVEYTRHLVGLMPSRSDERHWFKDGWCERPNVEPYVSNTIPSLEKIADNGCRPSSSSLLLVEKLVPEDLSPSYVKLAPLPDGFIIHNVTGIRTLMVQRLDGKGYDIRKRMCLGYQLFFVASSFQWAITLLDRATQSTSMTLTSFASRRRMPTLHRANSNVNGKCKSGFSLLTSNQPEQVKVFQATSWIYRLLVILHCSVQIFRYRIF
jgi:hypothetical protein